LDPFQKTLRHTWCPKLVTGLVPILTYGHESWVTLERYVLAQAQLAEMGS